MVQFEIEGGDPAESGAGTSCLNVSDAFQRVAAILGLVEIILVEGLQIQVGLWACDFA